MLIDNTTNKSCKVTNYVVKTRFRMYRRIQIYVTASPLPPPKILQWPLDCAVQVQPQIFRWVVPLCKLPKNSETNTKSRKILLCGQVRGGGRRRDWVGYPLNPLMPCKYIECQPISGTVTCESLLRVVSVILQCRRY